jgi:hypothetical protein
MAEIDTSQASAAPDPAQGLSQELQDYLSRPLPKPPVEPKGIGPEDIKKAYDAQAADITKIAQQQNKVDAATAEQMRGIQQKYEGQYQQAPEFKPTPESKQDLLALFGMLGAMGAMAGGKSYGSALGAMNAMGGMLNGYAQGRQDLFNREKAQFDEHLRSVQMHNQQISQAFDRAIKMAPYNLSESTNKLIQDLKSKQADMLAAQVQRDGTVKANESWKQLVSSYETELNKKMAIWSKMAPKPVGGKEYEAVKGQVSTLKNIIGDDVNRIGYKEIVPVSSSIESASETYNLAKDLEKKPWAAGLVGKTLSFWDRFIPSRYGSNTNVEADPSQLVTAAQNDPEIFKDVPDDKIAEAKTIQKRVVDVINARALAASGGSRMLISEFRAQSGVLDISGMSGETAAKVYENLANRDIEKLGKYFGQSSPAIQKIDSYIKKQPTSATDGGKKTTTSDGWTLEGP